MQCPELTTTQEAAINANHQHLTSKHATINDVDHQQRNLLHLVASKGTWSVGRQFRRNEDVVTIRTLLRIGPHLV